MDFMSLQKQNYNVSAQPDPARPEKAKDGSVRLPELARGLRWDGDVLDPDSPVVFGADFFLQHIAAADRIDRAVRSADAAINFHPRPRHSEGARIIDRE